MRASHWPSPHGPYPCLMYHLSSRLFAEILGSFGRNEQNSGVPAFLPSGTRGRSLVHFHFCGITLALRTAVTLSVFSYYRFGLGTPLWPN
jgi:hypothetical protein